MGSWVEGLCLFATTIGAKNWLRASPSGPNPRGLREFYPSTHSHTFSLALSRALSLTAGARARELSAPLSLRARALSPLYVCTCICVSLWTGEAWCLKSCMHACTYM